MLHGGIMAGDHSAVHLSPYTVFRRRPRLDDVDQNKSLSRCLFGVPDPKETHAEFRRVQDQALLDFEARWNFDTILGVPRSHVIVDGAKEMEYGWTQIIREDVLEIQEQQEKNESITPPNSPSLSELAILTPMLTPELIKPTSLPINTPASVTAEPLPMLSPEAMSPESMPMLTNEARTPEPMPMSTSEASTPESMPVLTPEETFEPIMRARTIERISVSPIQYFSPPNVHMGSQSSDEEERMSPVGLASDRFVAISASMPVSHTRRFISSSTSAAPSLKQRCITDYMKVKKPSRSGKKVLR